MDLPKIIVVLGTNASGKSGLGIELAKHFDGEIISADSRQVYRGFDLCSGKITAGEMEDIPHYMLDICDVGQNFSVADFQRSSYVLIPEIISRGKMPFVVGGTGLYIDSVAYGYNLEVKSPDYALRESLERKSLDELFGELKSRGIKCDNPSDSKNKRRIVRLLEKAINGETIEKTYKPMFNPLFLGLTWPKEVLHSRIDERLRARIDNGMIHEVENYLRNGGDAEVLLALGLEYKYIYKYLSGEYTTTAKFFEELSRAIKKFAKRQLTWFKRNKNINWLDTNGNYYEQAREIIYGFIG